MRCSLKFILIMVGACFFFDSGSYGGLSGVPIFFWSLLVVFIRVENIYILSFLISVFFSICKNIEKNYCLWLQLNQLSLL